MNIIILYICTGDYKKLFKEFYESSEKRFYISKNFKKTYLVLTDDPDNEQFKHNNVLTKYIPHREWPFNTLYRYDFILDNKNIIEQNDYFFFFNANTIFLKNINKSTFNLNKDFIFMKHPYNSIFIKKEKMLFETNPNCNACVTGIRNYYIGAFIAGKTDKILSMSEILSKYTKEDLSKNIIVKYHDESYLNKFIYTNTDSKILLEETFSSIEDKRTFEESFILLRNKNRYFNETGFKKIKHRDPMTIRWKKTGV